MIPVPGTKVASALVLKNRCGAFPAPREGRGRRDIEKQAASGRPRMNSSGLVSAGSWVHDAQVTSSGPTRPLPT